MEIQESVAMENFMVVENKTFWFIEICNGNMKVKYGKIISVFMFRDGCESWETSNIEGLHEKWRWT